MLPYGQMSLWGIYVPEMVDFNNELMILFNTIPFIKPKTRANKRIGPHNEDVISVIMGSMLGDSYGEKHGMGTRLNLQQEESNMEYLVWYHKFFNDIGYCSDIKPNKNIRIGKNNKIRYLFRFRTFTFTSFDWIREAFYSNGKKCVPKDIGKYLTPLALAIWIQNDGGKVSAGLKIATNCYTLQEVKFLCTIINEKYQLEARPQKASVLNQYIIYFPKSTMSTLSKLIKPYMVPSMWYKVYSNESKILNNNKINNIFF